MRKVSSLEAVYHDYRDEVAFFYVYKSLAHPERDGYVRPVSLKERLAHVAAAKRNLDTRIPWLADSMTNDLKHAFGNRPNSEFVISPDGEVSVARGWSDPEALREDLARLIGKSETTTKPSDLDRDPQGIPKPGAARGVVKRVVRPPGATPLRAKLLEGDARTGQALYVKLRVEAERGLLQAKGSGRLYLGFHLDPIHTVHWNNLAEPLRWEIELPTGVQVEPRKGVADKVEVEADVDPREFLLDVEIDGALPEEPLSLTVWYFACDDEEGWCRAVSQRYQVFLERDRDAGSVRAVGGSRDGERPALGGGRPPGGGRPQPGQLIARMDRDGDGKIGKAEARGPMVGRFEVMDADGDGFLTRAEIERHFARADGRPR